MNTTRRKFLSSALKITLGLGTIPFIYGCGNIIRKDLITEKDLFSDLSYLDHDSMAILNYASLAPSAHNVQPWMVQILSDKNWIVGVDEKRRLPAVDANNRATLFSIGTFLENLSQVASAMGYEPQIQIIAADSSDKNIAKVVLRKSKASNLSLDRLTKRMTVRKNILPGELKGDDIKKLTQGDLENIFYFPRSTKHAQCIEEAQVECYKAQNYRKAAMEEMKQWYRTNNQEAKKIRDGLTLGGMGIEGLTGFYIRNFMTADDMISKRSIKISIESNNELVRQGAGWFVFTSKSNSPEDIVEAGRKFERVALMARELNIALAPMTQILEEEKEKKFFQTNHKLNVFPMLIVRTGYVDKYPEPVTLRRLVKWFVKPVS